MGPQAALQAYEMFFVMCATCLPLQSCLAGPATHALFESDAGLASQLACINKQAHRPSSAADPATVGTTHACNIQLQAQVKPSCHACSHARCNRYTHAMHIHLNLSVVFDWMCPHVLWQASLFVQLFPINLQLVGLNDFRQGVASWAAWGKCVACALQDEIKDQLGNEETQAGILLDLGRASQAEEIYR